MNEEQKSPRFDGMVWPSILTVGLLALTGAYGWWKLFHPKAGDWTPGDPAGMLTALSVADIGQFVSGIGAALVLVWVGFTYRAQREELALQRQEMQAQRKEFKKLAGEAHVQSELLQQTSLMNKRDAFIRELSLRERELALSTADFLRIWANDIVANTQVESLWREYARGEQHVFYRYLIGLLIRGKHKDFLKRVDAIMNGRDLLFSMKEQAEIILRDAAKVDEQTVYLCRSMPWARMSLMLDYLLSGRAEGIEELPSELGGASLL